MIKKIDVQLEKYDDKVGSSLNVIESNAKGQISLADLQRAMKVIKHGRKIQGEDTVVLVIAKLNKSRRTICWPPGIILKRIV